MTQEEKQIKLAEAGRWKHIQRLLSGWHGLQEQGPLEELPDYFNDLNAVHELESKLPAGKWTRYCQYLAELSGGSRRFVSVHSAAHHRAEALGKTLNLW
jgi:hypothetical protein